MKNIKFIFIIFILLISFNADAREFKVKSGEINLFMDAPLEQFKGKTNAISGRIMIDESNLKSIQGSVDIDISEIVTYTFASDEKNKLQNEHMLNWFEIGGDVSPQIRKKYKIATLNINGAKSVQKKSANETVLNLEADLTMHGITKKVPLVLLVEKTGNGFMAKTAQPALVGLQEHDIRPRDFSGRLLRKTLAVMGQKVAKQAQVNMSISLQ